MATATLEATRPLVRELAAADYGMIAIPAEAHTYDGFLAWSEGDALPENLRVTYLDGEVFLDMAKESLPTHVAVKAAVYETLLPLVKGGDLGEFYPEGVLIGNRAAGVSNNPDGAAVLWETFESGRVTIRSSDGVERIVEGAPDWVMEVVSDHSVDKDTRRLREAYHRAEIREYWLIDARGEEILFQILQWRKKGYTSAPAKDGWVRSKVFGRSFRLVRQPNRRGAWVYNLEVKPL